MVVSSDDTNAWSLALEAIKLLAEIHVNDLVKHNEFSIAILSITVRF